MHLIGRSTLTLTPAEALRVDSVYHVVSAFCISVCRIDDNRLC